MVMKNVMQCSDVIYFLSVDDGAIREC